MKSRSGGEPEVASQLGGAPGVKHKTDGAPGLRGRSGGGPGENVVSITKGNFLSGSWDH